MLCPGTTRSYSNNDYFSKGTTPGLKISPMLNSSQFIPKVETKDKEVLRWLNFDLDEEGNLCVSDHPANKSIDFIVDSQVIDSKPVKLKKNSEIKLMHRSNDQIRLSQLRITVRQAQEKSYELHLSGSKYSHELGLRIYHLKP